MNIPTEYQESEKKSQALLRFAVGNHNAKRYNEAAGFYEYIIKCYPNTEASQFAQKNLSGLVNKMDVIEPVKPDETLVAHIEQSTESELAPNSNLPPQPNRKRPVYKSAKTSKPEPTLIPTPVKLTTTPLQTMKPTYPLNTCICANCGHVGGASLHNITVVV